jgi:hypothetical protein
MQLLLVLVVLAVWVVQHQESLLPPLELSLFLIV